MRVAPVNADYPLFLDLTGRGVVVVGGGPVAERRTTALRHGGAVVTDDDTLAERVRMLANYGQSGHFVHDTVGYNSRLDTLQAAVLSVKIPHLAAWTEARQRTTSCARCRPTSSAFPWTARHRCRPPDWARPTWRA